MTVFVIGAGVTGLTFAKVFGDTQVFESASTVGGKAASVTVDTDVGPFVFDTGGHWFHQQNSLEVLKLLNGLPMKKHVRKAFVLIKGCLYDFPFQRSYKVIPDLAFVRRVNDYKIKAGKALLVLMRIYCFVLTEKHYMRPFFAITIKKCTD